MTYYAIKNKLTGRYPTKTYIEVENDSPSMLYRDNRALIVKVNYWNNQYKKDNLYLYPVDLQPFNQELYEIVEVEVVL